MAQEYTVGFLNTLLGALPASVYLSAHTATPGLTGANEVSGGSYARVTAVYNAAASGQRALSSTVVLSIPATTTVAAIGLWSAITGTATSTFLAQEVLDTPERFESAGNLNVSAATLDLTNHPA